MRKKEFPSRELPEQVSQPSIFEPEELERASIDAQRRRGARMAHEIAAIAGKNTAKIEKNTDIKPPNSPKVARVVTEEEKRAREIGAPAARRAIAAVEQGLDNLENKRRGEKR